MRKKRILILIDWFHPAYKAGGPIQSIANLVEQYQQPGTSFKIYCGNKDLDGTELTGVPFDEWTNYNACTQVWYASAKQRSVTGIKKAVGNTTIDVLFIIGIYSWHFNLLPLLVVKAKKKILSARGMLHPGALSQKGFKKKIYLRFLQLSGLLRSTVFHATDGQEAAFIQTAFGKQATIFIAGNYPRVFKPQQAIGKISGALQLVSIALISPMKNIALVLEALQYCRQQIQYDIYGPVKDELYWRQCVEMIKQLPANITVQYKGALVPTEIEATLKLYEVFILPSKSENFGHAIFEALSAGKPVITSNHTPFDGLEKAQAGKNISLENISEITNAIDFFAAMEANEFVEWNKAAAVYTGGHLNIYLLREQYDTMFG